MTTGQRQINIDQIKRIADILMGAAYADGSLDGVELKTVVTILSSLMGGAIPTEVKTHLGAFRTEKFDLPRTCEGLELAGPKDRKGLLALVAKITEADEIHDLDESAYIRRVATHIAASPDEWRGLTVEIVSISSLYTAPPPIPKDS